MRFTIVAVVVAAVAFSSAAVIPRANLQPSDIESRYFRGEVYARVEPALKVVVRSEPLAPRRLHGRDLRMPTN